MRAQQIYQNKTPINVVRYQAANRLLVCATADGRVIALDASADFRPVAEIQTGLSTIDGLDIHSQERVIAVAGQGAHQGWNLESGRRLFHESFSPYDQSPPGYGSGYCLRFHQGQQASDWVLFGSYAQRFIARNWRTGERRELFVGSDYNVWIAFHPAGDLGVASLLIPQSHSHIGFFRFTAQGEYTTYRKPGINILSDQVQTDVPVRCCFTPDGAQLLTAFTNTYIMQTIEEVQSQGALLGVIRAYDFPGCRRLNEVSLWGQMRDLTVYEGYGENGETLYGAAGSVTNAVVLSGGDLAACGMQNGRVALVDLQRGEVAAYLPLHRGAVHSVDLLDAATLLTAGEDGQVMLCDLRPQFGEPPSNRAAAAAVSAAGVEEFLQAAVEGKF